MNEEDERVNAWLEVARHPFFADAYSEVEDRPFIEAVISRLDKAHDLMISRQDESFANWTTEPVEDRIFRAFTNGFAEGLRRAVDGRLDR